MPQREEMKPGEALYKEALQYNWKASAVSTMTARAGFERAAALHHTGALRELAEMMFAGAGGPREQERAIGVKWTAVRLGDIEALEDLSAMLESYAEELLRDGGDSERAARASANAEKAHELLMSLGSYVDDVCRYAGLSDGQV